MVVDVDVLGLHLKIVNFVVLVNFKWQRYNEVGNTGIFLLWRVCENPYSSFFIIEPRSPT